MIGREENREAAGPPAQPSYDRRLEERRHRLGLTQEQLAERLSHLAWERHRKEVGLDATTVCKWERGFRQPNRYYQHLLAQLFETTPEDLGFTRPRPRPTIHSVSISRQAATSAKPGSNNPSLVLVGGFAGSGKTEFGQFLSGITGWGLLDKDVLTRPFTESLLLSLGADPNDRHTGAYMEHVRPLEYRCLMNVAFNNLDSGVSTVVDAPFLLEMSDRSWLRRVSGRCTARGIDVVVAWVDSDVDSMYVRLQARDAARDAWKLTHWEDYLRSIDLSLRPQCLHFEIDNRRNAGISLAAQAHRLVSSLHHD